MSDNKSRLSGSLKLTETRFLLFVILANLVVKLLPAALIELGNDEVYYWTYALFPDWSHFDHPPLVGLTIQLFTLNLSLDSEIFIRLGSLVMSSANIILLFRIVKRMYSTEAARISSLLFTASVYFNIICGLFILPDTPQIFFVMLALYYGLPVITASKYSRRDALKVILFGLFTGLAFLGKYHSLYLWFGFGLYIVFHDRRWLFRPVLYLSLLLTLAVMTPVIFWNINNDFISFTFHESRVGLFNSPIRPYSFLKFNLGQFLYQNPVLYVIYILALISLFKKWKTGLSANEKVLLYLSLPLILVFTLSSLFKDTLPHWTGPSFIGLMILSSAWLREKLMVSRQRIINTLVAANALVLLTMVLGIIQINYGLLYPPAKGEKSRELGAKDVTLDMYGWHQAGVKFQQLLEREGVGEKDYGQVKIISDNWFPAANMDFYMAHPLKIGLLVSGTLEKLHKYYWINKTRPVKEGDRIFYITSSLYFNDPKKLPLHTVAMATVDSLQIERNGKTVNNLFVYQLVNSEDLRSSF